MINIPYPELRVYIMNYLNKIDINFTEQDLLRVEELYINPVDIFNVYTKIKPNILKYFKSLKRIEIANTNIDDSYLDVLSNLTLLSEIKFENCRVSNLNKLSNLKITKFVLSNCIVDDVENVVNYKHMNRIGLINMDLKKVEFLEKLPHLIEVDLSYSKIDNTGVLYHFTLIENLKIDNSNIEDLDFVNTYSGIKEISISKDQYKYNKPLIDDLVELGIKVYKDGVICLNSLGGDE